MIDQESGTCLCGHELDAHGLCVVWDARGNAHAVSDREGSCRCHGTALRELESRPWWWGA